MKKIAIKGTMSLMAMAALAGCGDLLDVNNPNNLVEESIRREAAASAVANGSHALVASSVSQSWQPYLVASDELRWIGSRDAWLSLDHGFVDDPYNEFIDGPFPAMGQARWMSDEAIEILTGHVGNNPESTSMREDLARANLYSGIIYMVIGEVQEDFAFSDKTEDGPPVGAANMYTVIDAAIARLDAAISTGNDDTALKAMAIRARAKHSRAIWDAINPAPSGNGLVSSPGAVMDADGVIAQQPGDWIYNFNYAAGTVGNSMASWINDRKENQVDPSLVTWNAANDVDGIAMMDPIDGIADPAVIKWMNQWKGGNFMDKGNPYPPLTLASTRMMHVIKAENALAGGDMAGFAASVNAVRAMDGLTPYSGQMDSMAMLQHTRRVNTLLQGLRLADMYRWGLKDELWQSAGATSSAPGTMLPISIIEVRANCHLNGLGCSG